jgi:8-oxo-dGTP pyrophosphatase MutT (NUDIX family)
MARSTGAPGARSEPGSATGVAADGAERVVVINDQDWRIAWHPLLAPPAGTPHGVAAVCIADDHVVLVSRDGEAWDVPAGRPDGEEDWIDTLRREVDEEACARVSSCALLGFSRGLCVRGPERGLVLVRSMWHAEVTLDRWRPRFETTHRRLVPATEALEQIVNQPAFPPGLGPLYRRLFAEAGL